METAAIASSLLLPCIDLCTQVHALYHLFPVSARPSPPLPRPSPESSRTCLPRTARDQFHHVTRAARGRCGGGWKYRQPIPHLQSPQDGQWPRRCSLKGWGTVRPSATPNEDVWDQWRHDGDASCVQRMPPMTLTVSDRRVVGSVTLLPPARGVTDGRGSVAREGGLGREEGPWGWSGDPPVPRSGTLLTASTEDGRGGPAEDQRGRDLVKMAGNYSSKFDQTAAPQVSAGGGASRRCELGLASYTHTCCMYNYGSHVILRYTLKIYYILCFLWRCYH